MLVDQSGSMCISRPARQPGHRRLLRAAAAMLARGHPDAGPRARAPGADRSSSRPSPTSQVRIVPCDTNVKNVWPSVARPALRPGRIWHRRLHRAALQAQLGKGTDYQGALAYAYGIIASRHRRDRSQQSGAAAPDPLRGGVAHRRNAVPALLGERQPQPVRGPDAPRAHLGGLGCPSFCNLTDAAGHRRDQRLRRRHGPQPELPDLQLRRSDHGAEADLQRRRHPAAHRAALQTRRRVQAAGPICQDIYGVYPNTAAGGLPGGGAPGRRPGSCSRWRPAATACTRSSGQRHPEPGSRRARLHLARVASNVLKTLIVQLAAQRAGGDGREVDSDGDGLTDDSGPAVRRHELTSSSPTPTGTASTTTSRSCTRPGLRPGQKDVRGCDPPRPLDAGLQSAATPTATGSASSPRPTSRPAPGAGRHRRRRASRTASRRGTASTRSPATYGLDTDDDGIAD